MGLFSSPIKTMDDLYLHTVQDIYYAESQIVKALPKMIESADDPKLKDAFEAHLGETKEQVRRLDRVFALLGQPAKGTTCPAINGIIEEAEDLISDCDDPAVRDAAMLAAAQAVEHYEISRYGTLIAWSEQDGRADIADLLSRTLAEEKAADEKLTAVAEAAINRAAEAAPAPS